MMKQLILGLIFGASMSFISWIVAMIINSFLMKTTFYDRLTNLNFITSKSLNQKIGLKPFKWVVKNSFFKFFNPGLKVDSKSVDFDKIRKEMTYSEVSHLIGFVLVTLVAVYKIFTVSVIFGAVMMIPNIFMNLYPSLLQQENKRRIEILKKRYNL